MHANLHQTKRNLAVRDASAHRDEMDDLFERIERRIADKRRQQARREREGFVASLLQGH